MVVATMAMYAYGAHRFDDFHSMQIDWQFRYREVPEFSPQRITARYKLPYLPNVFAGYDKSPLQDIG